MKKIINLILSIFMFLLLFGLLKAPERASGAMGNDATKVSEEQNGIEQTGSPWYDLAWHYRKAIAIANSGTGLPYYQILVRLDNSNFDFDHAKVDGSDIRFTDGSGKTPLYYWIESWNNTIKLAYVWVLVSNIAPAPNNTTIYLYYGNPAATTSSNGAYTFDFFDDNWCQFPEANCTQSQITQPPQSDNSIDYEPAINGNWILSNFWSIIKGSPTAPGGILYLPDGTGIKSTTPFQYQAVGFKANFGTGTGKEWGGFINGDTGSRTMIGDLPDPTHLYLINYVSAYDNSMLGTNNWHNTYHIYEVRWKNGQSIGDVDHGTTTVPSSTPAQVPNNNLPVTLYNDNGSNAILMVDWLYVRQYRDPEPTITIGMEQGLIDLAISVVDLPDPINTSSQLTYQVTVSNNSGIDAPGVVVTDTLPVSVQFISANSPGGCTHAGSEVVCHLNNIAANLSNQATIVAKPTVGGTIINSAIASSLGYDQDMSNNLTYTTTYVDTILPTANWVSPTTKGVIYYTKGGPVTLEVTAYDNDQVAYVEFWWNDQSQYIYINRVTTPPYRLIFDTDIIPKGFPYFFEARAYDRAGNTNASTGEGRAYIYILRLYTLFLPVVHK